MFFTENADNVIHKDICLLLSDLLGVPSRMCSKQPKTLQMLQKQHRVRLEVDYGG